MIEMMREHFSYIFAPLAIASGAGFQADRIPRLLNDTLDRLLQLELWDYALEYKSHLAYHNLAVITDPAYLEECLALAVESHEFIAIMSLCARMCANFRLPILHKVECAEGCESCLAIRCRLINFLELKQDWAYVRARILEGKRRKLWGIWKPLFFFNSKSDAITRRIDSRVRQGWSRVFAAVCIISMWRKWIERQLHPDSTFVKRVQTRWIK